MKKIFILFFMVVMFFNESVLANSDEVTIEDIQQVRYIAENIDIMNISKEELLDIYDNIVEKYSPEMLAKIVETNMIEDGDDETFAKIFYNVVKQVDTKALRNIIEKDFDLEKMQNTPDLNYDIDFIFIIKLLYVNKVIQIITNCIIVIYLYGSFIRGILFYKFGKNPIFAIIPIMRDVVMFQISDLPGLIVVFYYSVWLLPLIGLLILLLINILKSSNLASKFNKGAGFICGLIFLPLLFESILAYEAYKSIKQENYNGLNVEDGDLR